MLREFITEHKDAIVDACRAKMARRLGPPNVLAKIDHGIPVFLDQLVEELQIGLSSGSEIAVTASQHGGDLLRQGYSVSQVVHAYGDVCQAITDLAIDRRAQITAGEFRMLNRCLDNAIAAAVTQYGSERELQIGGEAAVDSDRVASLASDLRRTIRTANVALEVIKSGSVGASGSTGKVLETSLAGAGELTKRLLGEVEARRPKFGLA